MCHPEQREPSGRRPRRQPWLQSRGVSLGCKAEGAEVKNLTDVMSDNLRMMRDCLNGDLKVVSLRSE